MVQERIPARYRVIEEVGQGGMAVVYKAHDESLRREVAVKLLHPHLLAEPESKTRLEREAQAVAKLHHDNIVQIFDYSGSDAQASYIVTEFIDGQTLKQFIVNRRPPPPEVASLIAIEIGSALMHAHSLGIIHRDVKPDNVMVRKDGMLKLMDFGVAQIMDLERMTVTGQLLGSPAYMAPELLEGRPLDVRTDVFSVGIMLYQLATGALPFSGRNPHEVLKRIAEGKFADPRTINRLVADRLAKIIARALARRPEDRYSTVALLVDDLTAFVSDAGLGTSRDELRAFFLAPDKYEKEVVPRMIDALVANGKREREAKRTARALELWNRALGMDPSNREVLGELKHAASRQHLQRAAVGLVSAAVLAAGVIFVLREAGETTPPPDRATLPVSPGGIAASQDKAQADKTMANAAAVAGAPRADQPRLEVGGRIEAGRRAPVRSGTRDDRAVGKSGLALAPRPPGGAEMKTITIVPSPTSALITVDGVSQGYWGPKNDKIALDMSRDHEIVLRNDECCAPEVRRIGPTGELPENDRLVVRFKGRPARLTVVTDPAQKGKVGIREIDPDPGQQKPVDSWGDLGSAINVPFSGDLDMRKTLLLTVSVPGRPPKNERVELQAGKSLTKQVTLDD